MDSFAKINAAKSYKINYLGIKCKPKSHITFLNSFISVYIYNKRQF
jgi:hypothetical protein